MRAAVVRELGGPMRVEHVPVPRPAEGEVLVRMEASGLCHTDLHAAAGDWAARPTVPFVPGHEGVGRIEQVGPGVADRHVGQRVAIAWLGGACGQCRACIGGWETLCEHQVNSGFSRDGALAEYAVVREHFATPVPDAVTSVDAAPLTCAGVTTYKAVKVAGVRPGETVAVFGIGGLGHLAVQYARLAGAFVIAVDVRPDKLALAIELGADHVVDAAQHDPAEIIAGLGGADVALALTATAASFRQAYRSLRRGGRLVAVGLPGGDAELPVPIVDLVLGGRTVLGSIVGTRNDLADVFALHAAGRTRVITQRRDLDEVGAAAADLLAGRVEARVVFGFGS
ncbi:alcohol dehydrogenase catalytic domain-containing protein [Jatrophihabitans fulvus]